jgi:hypothetical protein
MKMTGSRGTPSGELRALAVEMISHVKTVQLPKIRLAKNNNPQPKRQKKRRGRLWLRHPRHCGGR